MKQSSLSPRILHAGVCAAQETSSTAPAAHAGKALPRWDLSALYAGMDDPALAADLAEATRQAQAFASQYQGKLAALGGPELAPALPPIAGMHEKLGRAGRSVNPRAAAEWWARCGPLHLH